MDEVYSLPTDTKLTQSNEKGLTENGQPFDNLVELRGNLTPMLGMSLYLFSKRAPRSRMLASQGGQPPCGIPRSMREILSLKLPLVQSPLHENKKGRSYNDQPLFILVELRGIEPLTPRLPG